MYYSHFLIQKDLQSYLYYVHYGKLYGDSCINMCKDVSKLLLSKL